MSMRTNTIMHIHTSTTPSSMNIRMDISTIMPTITSIAMPIVTHKIHLTAMNIPGMIEIHMNINTRNTHRNLMITGIDQLRTRHNGGVGGLA